MITPTTRQLKRHTSLHFKLLARPGIKRHSQGSSARLPLTTLFFSCVPIVYRFVWVRRASLYHASRFVFFFSRTAEALLIILTIGRLRLCSFYRKRSALDDLLIADMCELSLSVYVQIRRSAQKTLDSMSTFLLLRGSRMLAHLLSAHYFDGTRTLIYDRLFDALKRESLIPSSSKRNTCLPSLC